MVKPNEVARGVRVKLNDLWKAGSIGDGYLQRDETVWFISDNHIYNDTKGQYVHIKGGSLINSGIAYLTEIDLEFPYDKSLYNPYKD